MSESPRPHDEAVLSRSRQLLSQVESGERDKVCSMPDRLELLSDHELVHRLNTAAVTRGLTLLVNERGGEWHAALHPAYAVTGPDRRTAMIQLLVALEDESDSRAGDSG